MRQMLEPLGYVVTVANGGREAIRSLDRELIDLIVTDILMYDMDGFELIVALRKDFPEIPVIAISGGGNLGAETYLVIAKGFGADGVLLKPVACDELVKTIRAIESGSTRTESRSKPLAEWTVVEAQHASQEASHLHPVAS